MLPHPYLERLPLQGQFLITVLHAAMAYGFFALARCTGGWATVGCWLAVVVLVLGPCLLLLLPRKPD